MTQQTQFQELVLNLSYLHVPSVRWKADGQQYKWMYQADNDRTYQSSSHHKKRPQEGVYLLIKVIPSPTKHTYPPKRGETETELESDDVPQTDDPRLDK